MVSLRRESVSVREPVMDLGLFLTLAVESESVSEWLKALNLFVMDASVEAIVN